jgi:N-acetylglutamate synthase-like GNAT family acetyltransferase
MKLTIGLLVGLVLGTAGSLSAQDWFQDMQFQHQQREALANQYQQLYQQQQQNAIQQQMLQQMQQPHRGPC